MGKVNLEMDLTRTAAVGCVPYEYGSELGPSVFINLALNYLRWPTDRW
jgi:hypothetical protein